MRRLLSLAIVQEIWYLVAFLNQKICDQLMKRLIIHSVNPQNRLILQTVEALNYGHLIIFPTDTVYALGCDLFNNKAIEKIYRLKGISKKMRLSFICPDLRDIARYAYVSTPAYKIMRHLLPGPYTFILPASRLVPKILLEKKRTVGIRVPADETCQMLLAEFGKPIISTSARLQEQELLNDPELIAELFDHYVEVFLDAGFGGLEPSTIIDLTADEPVIIREGKGVAEAALGL